MISFIKSFNRKSGFISTISLVVLSALVSSPAVQAMDKLEDEEIVNRRIEAARFQEELLRAEKGNADALFVVARSYLYGKGIDPDYDKAFHYYTLAADQGERNSQYCLGRLYGLHADYEKSIHYYTLAADQGDREAQYNLGVIYHKGEGVPKDAQKAFHYYTLSADQGDQEAQYNLGVIYHKGEGVPKDAQKAFHYYTLSADQGDIDALYILGCFYQNAGPFQNVDKGMDLIYSAAMQGKKKAYEALEKDSNEGNPHASFYLGDMYETGRGVEQDHDKAHRYYGLADVQGHQLFLCGDMYEMGGSIVGQDTQSAYEYYLAAGQWSKEALERRGKFFPGG